MARREDPSALCGEPRFDAHEQGILLDPSLIVEVLSPSTESDDRGTKFAHYQKIPTLHEYVLFAQDAARAEVFVRSGASGDQWLLTTYAGLDAVVSLASVGGELPLAEAYERVGSPPSPPLRAVYQSAPVFEPAAV